jgi:hypothetical protein
MKRSILFLFLLLAGYLHSQTISLNGFVRNYTGILLNNGEYAIIQNTLDLKFEHGRDNVAFKANPYIYHFSDNKLEIDLREIFMDIYFETMDVRIGKQQIIWGKADGVFITDIVSPKDLREFLLPDFNEIRIGVTAVKFDYFFGDNTLELVWIPVFSPTRMPVEGSIWFPSLDFPMKPIINESKQEVKSSVENSELFAKYSVITSRVDFEIMAAYAWDDDPTLHTTKMIDSLSQQLTGITATPQHHRLGIGGGSFSTTLSGWVFRGEGAYYNGKYFNSTDPVLADVVVQKNYLYYLVGVDYTLWDINLSGQFVQQAILDYEDQIMQDEFENTMTLLARGDFLRETLTLELFSYIGLNNNDALIRPRIYYDLSDGFEILFGANIFTNDTGRFGQYNDNDMVYAKVKYSF